MITVTIKRGQSNQINSFTVLGHANSGPYGYDLVCAAVSAVTFGTVNAILMLCQKNISIDQAGEEGGYLHVETPSIQERDQQHDIQLLLEGMIVSLQTIERDYSEHIQIKEQ